MVDHMVVECATFRNFMASATREKTISELHRITSNPEVLGGKPIIRGLRIGVCHVLDLLAAGAPREEILHDYPYLEDGDISAALEFAALLTEKARGHVIDQVLHRLKTDLSTSSRKVVG